MPPAEGFDPFNDRRSRDIRNHLSTAFAAALSDGRPDPLERAAAPRCATPAQRRYVADRLAAYRQVLAVAGGLAADPPYARFALLWDHALFFECHEYLEPFWHAAQGAEKQLLQALILAAGVYVHLERGARSAAARLAARALPVLRAQGARLTPAWDPQRLYAALERLDPHPPRLAVRAD